MTVKALCLALAEKIAITVNAAVAFDAIVEMQPADLPAVYVDYAQTSVEHGNNYGSRFGGGVGGNASHRTHTGSGIVLIASSSDNTEITDIARDLVDKLLDAFERDVRLEDNTGAKVVDEVRITTIQPYLRTWSNILYMGVAFEWEAKELR